MTTIDTASAFYEDVVDGNEQSSAALAQSLAQKAREVREANSTDIATDISDDVRNELETALKDVAHNDAETQVEEIAEYLDVAAKDIRSSIGNTVIMKELDSGVAGQAQLGEGVVWIDSQSIRAQDGDSLIDTEDAHDIAIHEEEHTKQSVDANQEGVTINGKNFDAREVREAAAISVQKNINFLSAEYKKIAANLPMNADDRTMVREGDFSGLERKKNGRTAAMAT